jgi:hypothetical protein
MANPRTKAETSKFKDLKQGVAPQKENLARGVKKKRKHRPWKVLSFWDLWGRTDWIQVHSAETLDAAQKWVEKSNRGYGRNIEYKIIGPEGELNNAS